MAATVANIIVRPFSALALLALAWTPGGLEAQDQRSKLDVSKYLPPKAKLKNVVTANLEGDDRQNAVVFFTVAERPSPLAGIIVLKRTNEAYTTVWRQIHSGWDFVPPTAVYELPSAPPLLIAYRSLGASCPGTLSVFQFQGSSMTSVAGWPEGTCATNVEVKDLNGDGFPEIMFRSYRYGTIPEIYSWHGRAYRLANFDFPNFYNSELSELFKSINSDRMLPASARVTWVSEAVEIYKIQHRYAEAIRTCEAVLAMADNPELTMPSAKAKDNSPQALGEARAFDEADRARAKAMLHRLIGDLHTAQGDREKAEAHYKEADRLASLDRTTVR